MCDDCENERKMLVARRVNDATRNRADNHYGLWEQWEVDLRMESKINNLTWTEIGSLLGRTKYAARTKYKTITGTQCVRKSRR